MIRPTTPDRRRRPRLEPLEGRALLATLTVINTLDSGAGSLRQAITDANAASGASTIGFAIPGSGLHPIAPATALPKITQAVTIDGTTEPGYAGSPVIALDGGPSRVAIGLDFEAGSSGGTAKGLAIDRFSSEGVLINALAVNIEANDLGVDPAGGPSPGNGAGIRVLAIPIFPGAGDVIDSMISGNVIANNVDGIDLIQADAVTISGNFIGTDSTGRADLGNTGYGINAEGPTFALVANNVISDNGSGGIVNPSGSGLTLENNTLSNNGGQGVSLSIATTAAVGGRTGQVIMATYTVTNAGPNPATGVTLTLLSRSPTGSVFRIAGASASRGSATLDPSATSAAASFGTLAPGASVSVTLALRLVGSGTGVIDASADSDETPPRSAIASTAVLAAGTADLAVVASASPAAPRIGAPETFTFTVTNHDTLDSTEALFALDFSAPIFYAGIGSSPGVTPTGVIVGQGTVMELPTALGGYPYGGDLGRLAPGASVTVTAVIIPQVASVVSAALYAYSANDVDPTPANNLALAAARTSSAPPVLPAPVFLGADAVTSSATGPITSIQVDFQGALNVSTAQDVRNYSVTTTGSSAGIKIGSASYSKVDTLGFSVVTLRFARPQPRTGAPFQLVVNGVGSPGLTGVGSSARLATSTLTVPR